MSHQQEEATEGLGDDGEGETRGTRRGFFTGFAFVLWGLSLFWVMFSFVSYSSGEGATGMAINLVTALCTALLGVLIFRRGKTTADTDEGVFNESN